MHRNQFERVADGTNSLLAALRSSEVEQRGDVRSVEGSGTTRLLIHASTPPASLSWRPRISLNGQALHVRYRMRALSLSPGSQQWDDGRMILRWLDPESGKNLEQDPVSSLRGDQDSGLREMVFFPPRQNAVPMFWIENRGRSGTLELSCLELTPVRQRSLWRYGRWIVLGLMTMCLVASLKAKERGFGAAIASTLLWTLLALELVYPGPWNASRPFFLPFRLAPAPASQSVADQSFGRKTAQEIQPSASAPEVRQAPPPGALPLKGGWLLKVKYRLEKLRPLLHAMMLFVPTLVWAVLVGRRKALVLSVSLALAIELAQMGFGYGFDLLDVLDLAYDAVGITMGFLMAVLWSRRFKSQGSRRVGPVVP